jgi:hypothetical protein
MLSRGGGLSTRLRARLHEPLSLPTPPPKQFYHWRREVVAKCRPNAAHYALAAFEQRAAADGRRVTLLTQNVDGLHAVRRRAVGRPLGR